MYVDSTAAWTAGERGGTIFWYRYLEQRRYKRDLQAEGRRRGKGRRGRGDKAKERDSLLVNE